MKSNNSCVQTQIVMYKHNILNLWNKAIGVGQTQQHLKPVKSNNSCVQTQHPVK